MSNIAYIHGRPGPHPMHRQFAESVGSEFCFVDFRMRWQDKSRSIIYRLVSSFVCAFTFPNKKKYNVFLVDNLHFMPVIMKMLGLISRKQKIVAHMGSHTLYFIYAHRFSKFTEWLHIQALRRYDALICEGKMAEDLVTTILQRRTPKLYTVFNGVPEEHMRAEQHNAHRLNSKNILFIGRGVNYPVAAHEPTVAEIASRVHYPLRQSGGIPQCYRHCCFRLNSPLD